MSFRETTSPRFSSRTRVAIRFGAPLTTTAHPARTSVSGTSVDRQSTTRTVWARSKASIASSGTSACTAVRLPAG